MSDLPLVLVADDDEVMRLAVRDSLARQGPRYSTEAFDDGEWLWKRLLQDCRAGRRVPALILLDLYMPRWDGRDTLMAIRAHPRLRQIPVVVLTNSEVPADAREAYALGATRVAIKPRAITELRQLIQSLADEWIDSDPAPAADTH